jgi:cytokinin dehydrogenase
MASATRSAWTGVLAPQSAADVERIVVFANVSGLRLTAGASLDLSALCGIDSPDLETMTLRCEAAATWRDVVRVTAAHGLLPKVVPADLDRTIGESLAFGGFGATSHVHGAAVACVSEIDAVTGGGARYTCSETHLRAVYEVVLGGLGRAAVILGARIELRPFKPNVRTFYLLYEEIGAWIHDQRALVASRRAGYLEAACSPCIQGMRAGPRGRERFAQWFYTLQVTAEHDPGHAPDLAHVLSGLRPSRILHVEDGDTLAFASRHDGRNAENDEWLLSAETALAILPHMLEAYPLTRGEGPAFSLIDRRRTPPYFILPPGEQIARLTLEPIESLSQRLTVAGAKRVLSTQNAAMDHETARHHFGNRTEAWNAAAKALDPRGIFSLC